MITTTSYLGLTLAHPFMLGASPLTWDVDNVRRLEDAGCAAIVLHSLFEEQLAEPETGWRPPDWALQRLASGVARYESTGRRQVGPEEYLEQTQRIKAAVAIPVIASLNGIGIEAWLTYAPLLEQAGADALELNVNYVSTQLQDSALDIEHTIETFVRILKGRLHLPLAVKLSPFYTAFVSFAARLDAAGADGLVVFDRFYEPDIDIETSEMLPNLQLSTSAELLPRLHWLALLADRVRASLAVTGGVHTVSDGVKALLSGAHAVQMVSAILQEGPQHFRAMEQGLRYWMVRHDHESIGSFQGSLSMKRHANPAQFEREEYLRIFQSWNG